MNYENAVRHTWRHSELSLVRSDIRELVRYATLAASSHNTQPWRFEITADGISIRPDLTRRCSAVDPDNHHLYASLGCAAENLLLAGEAAGFKGSAGFDTDGTGLDIVLEDASPNRTPLFDAILSRQCSRTEFEGRALSSEQLRQLEVSAQIDGVSIKWLTGESQLGEVADYVCAGNTAQFADAAWADELQSWTRFNAADAIGTGDGLYGPVMGNPDVPAWIGKLYMKFLFSSNAQNKKDRRNIGSSSAIAVIFSDRNDSQHWIKAGRSYQRFALQAAALNLRTAFINQPVEVASLRPQFAAYLGLGDRRPDLIVRIGHGPLTPKTLRRALSAVIVDTRSTSEKS